MITITANKAVIDWYGEDTACLDLGIEMLVTVFWDYSIPDNDEAFDADNVTLLGCDVEEFKVNGVRLNSPMDTDLLTHALRSTLLDDDIAAWLNDREADGYLIDRRLPSHPENAA